MSASGLLAWPICFWFGHQWPFWLWDRWAWPADFHWWACPDGEHYRQEEEHDA